MQVPAATVTAGEAWFSDAMSSMVCSWRSRSWEMMAATVGSVAAMVSMIAWSIDWVVVVMGEWYVSWEWVSCLVVECRLYEIRGDEDDQVEDQAGQNGGDGAENDEEFGGFDLPAVDNGGGPEEELPNSDELVTWALS